MNDVMIYLIKVSVGLGIMYVSYLVFLRSDPNLILKRFYLIGGLLFSWIVPLLVIRRPEFVHDLQPAFFIDPGVKEAAFPVSDISAAGDQSRNHWFEILTYIYLTGVVLILLRNLFNILKVRHQWRTLPDNEQVVYTESGNVFAFFNRIYLPESLRDSAEREAIMIHEKAHIKQLHFIDLILIEMTLILTWFNPFTWLISRMIRENHEHLADRSVVSSGINVARYAAQLLNQTTGVTLFRLGHQFNHSLTFKRFTMMKKTRSSKSTVLKYIFLLPAVILILGISTGMKSQVKPVKGTVILADVKEPVPGAAVVVKGTTMGTVTDIDGSFAIEADRNATLVISFVGYATREVKVTDVTDHPIPLTRKIYRFDLDDVSMTLPDPSKDAEKKGSKTDEDPSKDTPKKNKYGDEIFYIVEELPSFPGGKSALKSYIYSNLDYPDKARKEGKEGEVIVQLTIPASGIPEDLRIITSTDEIFEKAAMKSLTGMPAWNPGKQRAKPVKTFVMVPVRFRLDGN
jgi:TonB family protein